MGMNPDTKAAHNRVEKYRLPTRHVPKLRVCNFILIPKNNKETGYGKIPQPKTPSQGYFFSEGNEDFIQIPQVKQHNSETHKPKPHGIRL